MDLSSAGNRMQRLATGMFIAMLAVLVLSNVFLSLHPAIGYVRAFAEAAVVGALADWFAVTALFRQPMGLPIPHTAIIPRNKERIGEALGRFVELNFASPEVVSSKLAGVDMAGKLARWLSDPERVDLIAHRLVCLAPQLLEAVDDHDVQRFVSGSLADRADRVNLGPLLGEALRMLTAEKRHQALLDKLLHEADEYITANEPRIRERVRENTAWLWQRLYMDDKVADNVVMVLREAFAEIEREAHHPLRIRLDDAIGKLVTQLADSQEYREQIAEHTRKLLGHPLLRDYISGVWRDIRRNLQEEAASDNSLLKAWLYEVIHAVTQALLHNEELRDRLNEWMHDVAVEAVQSHQREVGSLIADTVREWDTETVTRRIEQRVGEDLQYIRINGTLIGGLVGLTIYTVSRAFG
jgi:uncharacterized membrane-anchored protein YjiN (DUF445 family)